MQRAIHRDVEIVTLCVDEESVAQTARVGVNRKREYIAGLD